MVEQAGVEGRHAHQRRRPRQRGDDRVGVEARLEDHRRPGGQRDVHRDEQAVGMEDRQRVDQHVVGAEAPQLGERQRVGREIVVGQHRALRAPGGPRGVEDGGEIVGAARDRRQVARRRGDLFGEAAVAPRPQAVDRLEAELGGERARRRQRLRAAERQRRRRVVEEIFELGERIGGVERQQRRPRLEAGERQHDAIGRFVDLRRDPVARLDAAVDERPRRPPGAGVELGIGQRQAVGRVDRQSVAARALVEQQVEEIGGHRGALRRWR